METQNAASKFAALSQATRVEILKTLIQVGPGGLAAGVIAETLDTPAPTMSFHLKELQNAGIILSRREGRSVIYAADYGGLRDLIDFLMAECCQGDPRLCGPYIINPRSQSSASEETCT
jgi:DNA-binding transcriptional ArsR family regulator